MEMNEGCLGYSDFNGESTEYDCEYEFSGETCCEECIFGPFKGNKDPRVDPYAEEEE